jgi:cytochrome c oxidase subunit 1
MSASTKYEMTASDKRFIGWHMFFAIAALSIGSLFGPLQAFEHAGWDIYAQPWFQAMFKSYYQGLTLHGVLNALIYTTFFITGFTTFTIIYGLKRRLRYPIINHVGWWMMVVGLVTAAIPLLLDWATVLYTFYAPMKAHWLFYVGLVLVVVGSWTEGYGFYLTYMAWRKENPGVRTPLMSFMGLINMVMWQIATIGIAAEILFFLLPWALGLTKGVDPLLTRTLFWWTGHPLVYFWVLAAYTSWYTMLPKQVGGKLFSDSLARLAFWLFLVLSVPLGFHHQYVDPGVPQGWKIIHSVLTFSVFLPSMFTLFTVTASLESGGRARGGKGWLGWLWKLPWGDPSVSAQLLAGILFMFGGIGGLINASYNINLVIHNTTWVPGHFHLTVSSAATLSFMGISFWLVPYITGKKLWKPKWALVQVWLWFIGMTIFSNAMHVVGLLGAPRRTPLGLAPYVPEEWSGHLLRIGIGGGFLLVSVYLYIIIMAVTALSKKVPADEQVEPPIAESIHDPQETPAWLDRWVVWLVVALALLAIAYGPQIVDQLVHMNATSPGFKVW